MGKSGFTGEQIVGVLGGQETDVASAEVSRRPGISGATFDARKAKSGGLGVCQARKPKGLEGRRPD